MEALASPSIFQEEEQALAIEQLEPSWIDPIISYLDKDDLSEDKNEARRVKHKSLKYWLSPVEELCRISFTGHYLHCVLPDKVQGILFEIHEGICGSHVGERSLTHRAISQGYWWPYRRTPIFALKRVGNMWCSLVRTHPPRKMSATRFELEID